MGGGTGGVSGGGPEEIVEAFRQAWGSRSGHSGQRVEGEDLEALEALHSKMNPSWETPVMRTVNGLGNMATGGHFSPEKSE